MKKIMGYLNNKGVKIVLGLVLLAAVFRVPFFFFNTIPFSFDHGKDSLAIMNMLLNQDAALIGPWTSIPGLYFGPGWYYLLAPGYLMTGFNPVGGAITMCALLLISIWLVHRYFGFWPALIAATAPFWFIISISAWNPYPMVLISIGVHILLWRALQKKMIPVREAAMLAVISSLGFHFSAAFAIFYPVIVAALLIPNRVRISVQAILAGAAGFLLPFLPQLIFEVRHNFVQSKAVLAYFSEGESHALSLEKITTVVTTTWGEVTLGFLPLFEQFGLQFLKYVGILVWLAVVVFAFLKLKSRKRTENKPIFDHLQIAVTFFIIPVVGFFFLHFNVWYVYAIVPPVMIFLSQLVPLTPRWLKTMLAVLLLASAVSYVVSFYQEGKQARINSYGFLPVKLAAIQKAREVVGNDSFASYHYVPDIYDFSYHYLYFWQATQGQKLPVEMSYEPNAPQYIVEKPALLNHFSQTGQESATWHIYIVETANPRYPVAEWWGRQQFSEIVAEYEISPEVKLYLAKP